jgi:hypothetical protein
MEEKFLAAWEKARLDAKALGVRLRPETLSLALAQRQLGGHRDSDGFAALARKGRLDLSLEALAIQKAYTALFTDEEANTALMRLLEAGYTF